MGRDLLLMPAVAAVIHNQDGRLLLLRKHDGSWSLPAGAVEPGETPEQAVAREVLEETGYECTSTRLLTILGGPDFRHTYPNGDQVEYLILLYHCEAQPAGDFTDTAETESVAWFTRLEMPPLALPYDLDLLFQRSAAEN